MAQMIEIAKNPIEQRERSSTACDPASRFDNKEHGVPDEAGVPLCVDLDGTLVKTDMLVESFFALLSRHFVCIIFIPWWIFKGRAYLKQEMADRTELDVTVLPYHSEFLDFLKQQHKGGRRLILATASNHKFARQIADHLGIFESVLASDALVNLSAAKKLAKVQMHLGGLPFDYAGNSREDLAIWPHARTAILVNTDGGVLAAAERASSDARIFDDRRPVFREYVRAIRLHQWLKNLLLFVPLLAAHQFASMASVGQAVLGFLAFSLCASSVYLLNDLLDLPADRRHPRKRKRPFASGSIPILHGVALIPVLLLAASAIAMLLPWKFLAVLGTYYFLTITYSCWLKKKVLVDVVTLAGLYTLRIVGGAAATSVSPSFWLLAFSMFLFFSLAMVKRYSELDTVRKMGEDVTQGRGYQVVDMESLSSLGISSGFVAVLVLALYINSDDVKHMYTYPEAIWFLCPLLLYWVSRVWLATRRGKMNDDPIVFAFRDHVSRGIALISVIIMLLAL